MTACARPSTQVSVVDLFCGIGGLTHGLKTADLSRHLAANIRLCVKAGFDIDESCRFSYESNNSSDFICKKIEDTTKEDLLKYYGDADFSVLVGCAPCQPFSQLAKNRKSGLQNPEKWAALRHFSRLVKETKPDIVSMENVPGLMRQEVYRDFKNALKQLGYNTWDDIVQCAEYGVPQRRKRLVLLASKHGEINLRSPAPDESGATARNALEKTRCAAEDSAHIFYNLSSKNKNRIMKSEPGKYKEKWDTEMLLVCHQKHNYPETYGRMAWDKPAPTITAQFCFYSCGRFGHPEKNRAITIREGALLQTFPPDYRLIRDDARRPNIRILARQIGNAVPPQLGRVIGESIAAHVAAIGGTS